MQGGLGILAGPFISHPGYRPLSALLSRNGFGQSDCLRRRGVPVPIDVSLHRIVPNFTGGLRIDILEDTFGIFPGKGANHPSDALFHRTVAPRLGQPIEGRRGILPRPFPAHLRNQVVTFLTFRKFVRLLRGLGGTDVRQRLHRCKTSLAFLFSTQTVDPFISRRIITDGPGLGNRLVGIPPLFPAEAGRHPQGRLGILLCHFVEDPRDGITGFPALQGPCPLERGFRILLGPLARNHGHCVAAPPTAGAHTEIVRITGILPGQSLRVGSRPTGDRPGPRHEHFGEAHLAALLQCSLGIGFRPAREEQVHRQHALRHGQPLQFLDFRFKLIRIKVGIVLQQAHDAIRLTGFGQYLPHSARRPAAPRSSGHRRSRGSSGSSRDGGTRGAITGLPGLGSLALIVTGSHHISTGPTNEKGCHRDQYIRFHSP